ncbi:MAG: AmmeMemoRadiSam system protein B [Candidatus Latescibacterota bacterium]|nr:MAG: AmmeMemoRadiSam system protein B [Candidatus Latescibacterota bacterium]
MSSEQSRVRKPAVAGSFYPNNPKTLRRDIDSFLSNVSIAPLPGRPLVLIEPHAGYMYSGQTAAYGYKLIENLDIKTVAVISPSHMEYFPFVSIFDGKAYETPLGRIAVDTELAQELASSDSNIRLSNRGHVQLNSSRQEHALEVQLPFLQSVLGDFRLVPIVMGDQNWDLCSSLGAVLSPHLARRDFLTVVSSDLSHFHHYEAAQRMDGIFCGHVEEMNAEALYDSVKQHRCEACGAGPVIASLIASRRAGASQCRILHTTNSGDVTGDRQNVVGYAAAVVHIGADPAGSELEEQLENDLTPDDQSHLLKLARHAVEQAVEIESDPPPRVEKQVFAELRGAFVTLKIDNQLRGCIGTIEAHKPLRDVVTEMARAAAMSDPRFTPLTKDELPGLGIEISVLSPLRRNRSQNEVEVGKHGLVIEKGMNRGLLLPQVATEHGWDVETFLSYTCEKAGLNRSAWRDEDTQIHTFTAEVFGEEKEFTR